MTFFVMLIGLLLCIGSFAFYLEFEFYTIPNYIMTVICAGTCILGVVYMALASSL